MELRAGEHASVRVGKAPILLFGLAFSWAVAGSVRLITSARYAHIVTGTGSAADAAVGQLSVSLTSVNGAWLAGLIALVTIGFGLPLGTALAYPDGQRPMGWTIGLLGLVFSILSGFSIGLTYLPSALLILFGAALSWRPQGSRAATSQEG